MATGVLIVEDEFLLRMDAADFMEDAGFTVYQASNADDAIALLEATTISGPCSPTSKCRGRWTV